MSRGPHLRLAPPDFALRFYSPGERIADGCIHAVGIAASFAALGALMALTLPGGQLTSIVGVTVYACGLVAVFVFSACYHLIPRPDWKAVLRRLDHSAIFIMIAGTYTPFALLMGGPWGLALLAGVWTVTVVGVTLKLFFPHRLERVSVSLYLVQGWAVVAAFEPMTATFSGRVLLMLGLGGCLYTLGIVFHVLERLPYHNAIWHGLVLAAASCHFVAVVDGISSAHAL